MRRISFLFCALAIAASAHGQQFPIPGKPIRIVVPFATGGQTDVQARAIAQKMSATLGIQVIVENKPGGSTVIGAREVQKAAPDGHTLLFTISTHVQIPHLFNIPPWNVYKDFTSITAASKTNTLLTAHVSAPYNNVVFAITPLARASLMPRA